MRILVIRFKLMGDVILSSAVCSSLKKSFPDSTIDFVCYAPYSDLFENHPHIDTVYGISRDVRKSPWKYLRLVRHIGKNNYDIVIDAQSTAKSNFFVLFSRQAQFKITRARKRFSIGHTHQINKPTTLVDKVKERLIMLDPLTEKHKICKTEKFELAVTEHELDKARKTLDSMGIDPNKPLFVFAVSANEPFKKWNTTEMKALVEYCQQKYAVQILLFSGLAHEREDVNLFKSQLQSQDGVFSNCPIESLRCLPALFSHCDLFIGNEGGPRHIAHGVGTPSVSIFSPHADRAEWFPNGSGNHWAIGWKDVKGNEAYLDTKPKTTDSNYDDLYNSIKAQHVIPLIDKAVLELDI